MENQQELEWEAAQSTAFNVDLVSAAKTQLKFLAAVDRNRWLYEGPGLDRAIYRYNAYWLPMLAKHSESPLFEGPLVVPLDCEWVWHCHRLNPVRYKLDCQKFYGRLLDNKNVISSLEGISTRPTADMWKTLFPGAPYELNIESVNQDDVSYERAVGENCTKYDFISAAQRQAPFFYQVSGIHMNDNRYIEGSVARYKGFLHLIKSNMEKGIKSFTVPTYDIDLIWHTHQLHPVSYCEDLVKMMGKILGHDDTDSDRTKGQKLDVGFSGTTRTFEDMYGCRYWRAGAMYKGSAPSPVRLTPYSGTITKKVLNYNDIPKVAPPAINVFEVMLEIVGVRNLPEGHDGNLYVSFSKSQPDMIFNAKRTLTIFSESGEMQVASFQCQPTGHLFFELMSSSSDLPLTKLSKTMGTTSIPLEDFLSPDSDLTVEKWLDLVPISNMMDTKPVGLRVAISVTIPTPAPYTLHMARSQPFTKSSCLFPLPVRARIVDGNGNMVLSLLMRDLPKQKSKKECRRRVVVGIMDSGKTCILAKFTESKWSMVTSPWSLKLPNENNDDGHFLEMTGPHTVRLFRGGRLDYDLRRFAKHKAECQHESHLITAVKFSAEEPYGTAVGLFDMNSDTVKANEEWFLLPGLIVTFILGNIWRKDGHSNLMLSSEGLSNGVVHNPAVKSVTNRAHVASGACGVGVASGACGVGVASGACGVGVASGACGVGVASGACGGCVASGACGIGVASGACGIGVASGACGVGVASGACGVGVASGACGVGVASGACGVGVASGACGVGVVSGACGVGVPSGACGVGIASGVGVASGACGVGVASGACGVGVASGACGVGVASGACGVGVASGACGVGVASGACGVGDASVASGACGVGVASACGVGIANGACGVGVVSGGVASACGVGIANGACGVGVASGACGVGVSSGACGVTSGRGKMAVAAGVVAVAVEAN